MIFVDRRNDHCRVLAADERERRWLEGYLSYEVERFSPGRGKVVDKVSLVTAAGQFPSGFLLPLLREAREDCVRFDVKDMRVRPCDPVAWENALTLPWLRHEQVDAVSDLLEAERGILQAPTAYGKTEVLVAVCTVTPCRWLVLTDRLSLIEQLRNRFARRTGEVVGQLGDGVVAPRRVTVATFASVRAMMRRPNGKAWLAGIGGVFVDECHCAGSPRNRFVLHHLPGAYYRFGTSATPLDRGDRRNPLVVGAIGPVVHKADRAALVAEGRLAQAKVTLVPVRHPETHGSYGQVYSLRVGASPDRTALTVRVVKEAVKPVLVFVKELAHGRRLESALRSAGVSVEFVWGAKNTHERRAAVGRLETAETDALVCNVVFQEGVDIPCLRTVVLASGGKSVIEVLQRLGRGSRVDEGKTEFDLVDIWDKSCGCGGRQHRSCRWFESHARKRRALYEREGYAVTVRAEEPGPSVASKPFRA